MNKLFNKVLAVVLAGTMVVGASVTAFADDINSATGAGESTGHLDTSVVTAVLPTASVDSTFTFTVDPENILDAAGAIKGGSTAVTANEDLVYFLNAGDTPSYSSTSDAVAIGAKNYVAADVSVKAEVGDPASGKTIIPLLDAAPEAGATVAEPSLLLTLKVGTKSGAITADGVTVTDQIAAQNAKFDVVWDSSANKYKLSPKTKDASENDIVWSSVNVQMTGKVYGGGTTTDTVVAPTVTLTWSVAAHVDNAAPSIATTTYNLAAGTAVVVTTNLGVGASAATSITGVEKPDGGALASSNYTVNGNVITFSGDWVDKILVGMEGGASKKYKVVFNTGDKIELTFTKPNG